jgi:hypothetical protein
MEAQIHRINFDTQLLQAAHCEHGFACLHDEPDRQTVRFMNKDVEVIKCLAETPCSKRRSYDGMQICTCPVRRKLHGL